jgi:hypothetical protein
MEDKMSKFPEFDEKETKEGNIRRVFSIFLGKLENEKLSLCTKEEREYWDTFKKGHTADDEYDKRLLGVCSKAQREEVMKVTSELLTEEEAKQLLEIANYDDNKFWFADKSLSDKEKFIGGFYHKVLPTVMSVFNPRFDSVRVDFLRYFILWDNFAEKRRYEKENENLTDNFFVPKETFNVFKNGDNLKSLENFSDIPALYKFVADEITAVHLEKRFDREIYTSENKYLRDQFLTAKYNNAARCFYETYKGLLNNIGFLTAAVNQNLLSVKFVFETLKYKEYVEKCHEISAITSKMFTAAKSDEEVIALRKEHEGRGIYVVKVEDDDSLKEMMPEHDSYDEILHCETKEKLAKIFFSNDEMTNFLAEGNPFEGSGREDDNRMFFNFILKLAPEYKMPVIRRVVESVVKKMKDYDDPAYFASRLSEALVIVCSTYCGEDAVEPPEVKQFILETFLREKIVKTDWFKELPELFQQLVIVEQARWIFKKAEIVVVPNLPETDINKDELKRDVDKFLGELAKIARNGGKPSDYYAGEHFESDQISDPESYLTSLFFDTAVFFLKDSFGAWKALKPMLAIFRNLREQAYSIDIKPYEFDRYIWGFVPFRITPFLGSLESDEAEEVCEEWFKHLAGELKSADDFVIKKREENPETVPEEFRDGYDIKVIEPHPLWREAYCEAAGDLRVNLGFNNCKIFNHLKKNDIDKDVREAAEKTLERIEKIKGKFDSGSRKRALLNAWWWYRVAHLKSLGIDFDWVAAQNLKIKEVKVNYQKD